jgi:hypothetical protein
VHLPRAFGNAQLWQASVQAVRQQTPSAQKPVAHWSLLLQLWPLPRLPQLPPAHIAGAAHCVSFVQLVTQLPSAHIEGAQATSLPATQVPCPSHMLAGTKLLVP